MGWLVTAEEPVAGTSPNPDLGEIEVHTKNAVFAAETWDFRHPEGATRVFVYFQFRSTEDQRLEFDIAAVYDAANETWDFDPQPVHVSPLSPQSIMAYRLGSPQAGQPITLRNAGPGQALAEVLFLIAAGGDQPVLVHKPELRPLFPPGAELVYGIARDAPPEIRHLGKDRVWGSYENTVWSKSLAETQELAKEISNAIGYPRYPDMKSQYPGVFLLEGMRSPNGPIIGLGGRSMAQLMPRLMTPAQQRAYLATVMRAHGVAP